VADKAGSSMPKKRILAYNQRLKPLARLLTTHSTLSEILLWQQLRGKKMLGYDFDRQKPIDDYIVDFFCKDLSLAIEIDGDSHRDQYHQDSQRQIRLEELGVSFLRFPDRMVKQDMSTVLRCIQNWIEQHVCSKEG
jgi:very-short-patch-repair endonuclease